MANFGQRFVTIACIVAGCLHGVFYAFVNAQLHGLARQLQIHNPYSNSSYNHPNFIYALRPQATLPPSVRQIFKDAYFIASSSRRPRLQINPVLQELERRKSSVLPHASVIRGNERVSRRFDTVEYAGDHVRSRARKIAAPAEHQCPSQVLHVPTKELRISACSLRGESFMRVKINQYNAQQGKVTLKLPYATQYRTKTDVTNLFRIDSRSGAIYFYGRNINPGEKAHIRIFLEGKIRNTPCTYTKHFDVLFHCLPPVETAAETSQNPAQNRRVYERPSNTPRRRIETNDSRQLHQRQQQNHREFNQRPPNVPTINAYIKAAQPTGSVSAPLPTQQQSEIRQNVVRQASSTEQRHLKNVAEVDAYNRRYAEKLQRENQQQQKLRQKPFVLHKIDNSVGIIKPFWTLINQQTVSQTTTSTTTAAPITTATSVASDLYWNPTKEFKPNRRHATKEKKNKQTAWNEEAIKTRPYMKPYALQARTARIADWSFADLSNLLSDAFTYGFDTFGYPGFKKSVSKYNMENPAPV